MCRSHYFSAIEVQKSNKILYTNFSIVHNVCAPINSVIWAQVQFYDIFLLLLLLLVVCLCQMDAQIEQTTNVVLQSTIHTSNEIELMLKHNNIFSPSQFSHIMQQHAWRMKIQCTLCMIISVNASKYKYMCSSKKKSSGFFPVALMFFLFFVDTVFIKCASLMIKEISSEWTKKTS